MVLPVDTRRRLYEQDSRWSVKAILRFLTTGFALLSTILFAASVSFTNANFINTDGNGDWTDGLALAPLALSLLTNPISLISLLFIRQGNHFHPAWLLTADLIIWTMSIPAIIFSVAGGLFWYWTPGMVDPHNGNVDCGFFFNEFSIECDPIAYTIGRMEIAAVILLFFVFVLHFALFVFACIDTHKWRQSTTGSKSPRSDFDLQSSDGQSPPAYPSDKNSVEEGVVKFS